MQKKKAIKTKDTAPGIYRAPDVKVVPIRSQGIICTSPGFESGDGGYNDGDNFPIN